MKRAFAIAIIISLFSVKTFSQFDAGHCRISVLTCGPGNELYSLFGHTGIRIFDSTTNLDVVYNWGGFTFAQPNFYLHFVQGNLLYFSIENYFNDFMQEYVEDHRSVFEQVLNLDSTSKKNIIDAIIFNSTGDNKYYKYDGFVDNCTTRIKNILYDNLKTATITTNIIPAETTSRDLMHFYLEKGNQLWTELGLDIIVGSAIDKSVSNDQSMFLPEFFMKGLSNTEYKSTPLVKSFKPILQGDELQRPSWKYLPLAITSAIFLLIFFISALKTKWSKSVIKFIDGLLLYVTGLIGVLLLVMWFATDHIECKNNFNIAWALPTNLVAAFCLTRKPSWLSKYFFLAFIITALLIATWFWLPQQLNVALLPVVIYLLSRYVNFMGIYKRS